VDDDLQEHRGTVELVDFETGGSHVIIIGLPDIVWNFVVYQDDPSRKQWTILLLLSHSTVRPSGQVST
jgi:hypothetical protein